MSDDNCDYDNDWNLLQKVVAPTTMQAPKIRWRQKNWRTSLTEKSSKMGLVVYAARILNMW